MVKLVALQKGYALGRIIEQGEAFSYPDDLWDNEKVRPSWAKPALFGGRGDHDGDGKAGGAVPAPAPLPPAGQVAIPEGWRELPAKDRKALAKEICNGTAVANAADADKVIEAYAEGTAQGSGAPTQEPFADAPPPAVVSNVGSNGLQQAFGGGVPDWVDPNGQPTLGSPTPKLADD